jgi:4-hydroxy-tetrahydrodipicolinate synthase
VCHNARSRILGLGHSTLEGSCLNTVDLKGVIPPVITPFKEENEDIDESALREQVRFLIESGVDGVFSCGTSGEFFALTSMERQKVNSIVVDAANGKVPVLVGTGASSTRETLELTRHARDIGADFAVIVVPYFTRPTENGILRHYNTIATTVEIPIAVYNIPGRVGVNVDPMLAARIAEIRGVVAMKDSSGNMVQFSELLCDLKNRISIFQGEDQLMFESLVLGAEGVIPAVANVAPKLVVELYADFQAGRLVEAREKQFRVNRLMRECLSFKPWPVGIKETLNILGRNVGVVRCPLTRIDDEARKQLKATVSELVALGLLD